MDKPKICVCVPCYNNEDTIQKTLTSIINQTYDNFNVIIIDNCSTDSTISKINEVINNNKWFADKVKIIKNDTNIGACANWNKCLDLGCDGEFMCLYHADDVYCPEILEKEVHYLLKNKSVNMVFTGSYLIDANDKIIQEQNLPIKYAESCLHNFDDIYECLIKEGNIMMTPSVMFRSNILKKYYFSDIYRYAFDLGFFVSVGKIHGIGFLNEKLIKYRLYSNASETYRVVLKYKHTLHDDFMQVIKNNIIEEGVVERFDTYEYIRMYNLGIKEKMIKAFINGDYQYAKKMLKSYDTRCKYKRLWIWNILVNCGLPEFVRKVIAYKRYKNYFKGQFSNIKCVIEE